MERLVVETITKDGDLVALEPEWVALEEASGNALPFRTAAWTLSWWEHLRRTRVALHDVLSLRTVRTSTGQLVGVAPMMITSRPGRGPLRTRCLQFLGTDPNVTELRGPLFLPELEEACFRALGAEIEKNAGDWDWVVWSGVPAESGASLLLEQSGAAWAKRIPFYVLPLTGDWASFKSTLPRNVKESLRKCYNSLKRDDLAFSLEVVTARSEIRAAVEDVFRLHAARSSREDTIRHADVFAEESVRAFVIDVCERLADRGITRIFRLRIGGAVVATRIGFALGKCLYLYYSGFDPALGKYSVMTTTVSEAIQYAFAEGFTSVNLSSGNDVSKTRWNPDERVHVEGSQVSEGLRGRLAHGVFKLAIEALRNPRVAPLAGRLASRR